MFSWRIILNESEALAVGQTENTCTCRVNCNMEGSSKRHKFFTQSMPRTRRDTALAAKEDTLQVVGSERHCTLYAHEVEDIVTRFLMKTMQERAVKWE